MRDGSGTDRKFRQISKYARHLPERKPVRNPQRDSGRQSIEPKLAVGNVGGGRLLGSPRLDTLTTAGAPAAAGVVALDHDPGRNDVFDQPLMSLQVKQAGVAAWTGLSPIGVLRQRHLRMNIDVIRHWTQRRGMTLLSPRPLAAADGHRWLYEKRRRSAVAMNWVLRSGRPFLQLLFEQFVFRGQFDKALLDPFDPLMGMIKLRTYDPKFIFQVIGTGAIKLSLFLKPLVRLELTAVHGRCKLPRSAKSCAPENAAAR